MSDRAVEAPRRRPRNKDGLWPIVFLAPLLIGIAVFYFWPILATVLNSFSTFGPFGGRTFAGLENYAQLFQDSFIPRAILNTAVYTAIVLLGIPIAVGIASLLTQKGLRFSRFYQILFFLPAVSMPVAVALVWRMIFNKEFGLVNYLLSLVGIEGPYWVTAPWWSLLAVSIAAILGQTPFAIMIAIGASQVPIFARLLRASMLQQRSSDYVLSAQTLGLGRGKITMSHVLPNAIGPVIVQGTLTLATAVIDAAALSFLGLGGGRPETAEWGRMLTYAQAELAIAPWLAFLPGICIAVTALGFTLLGEALREAMDPRTRAR